MACPATRWRCAKIKGHKSREIETMLGYRGRDEMIHADNLVVIDN